MTGVSSQDGRAGGQAGGHGRRARRDGPAVRPPARPLGRRTGRWAVGPVTGWVTFTLLVTAGVLLVLGLDPLTVLGLLAAGLVLGLVLLLAARLSPPERGEDVTPGDGRPS